MTVAELWTIFRAEQTRLINESSSPHLSVAEAEQQALAAVLAEVGVQVDDEPARVGSLA